MKAIKTIALMGLGLSISACAAVDVPTRNAPFEQLPVGEVAAPAGYELTQPAPVTIDGARVIPVNAKASADAMQNAVSSASASPSTAPLEIGRMPVSVNTVTVRVPRSLKVSEANRYLPKGDIVWREDPIGDRHAQVQKIFEDALITGVSPLNGPVKVDVDVQVLRFHALTEKARYTTGGVHSITFELAIKNPATGELLVPVRTVRADLDGFGGQQALLAEARGQTQKVRISAHLAEVIRQELTNPEGYQKASLGFMQMLNGS